MSDGWHSGARVLGRYVLREVAGKGGQGVVWDGTDAITGRRVAVKQVKRGEVRYETTALMAARFPGMVELLDQGEWGGAALLVMEYVEGVCFPGDTTDPARLTILAQQVLDVLDRLHTLGIVHRDLKPSNVLVGDDGRPTVLDLGLASGEGVAWSESQDQANQGTLRYIAPEQLLDDAVDPRSDLYSLGVVLYEAVSGQLPHDGADLVGARLGSDPVPLAERGVPPSRFTEVVDRLVARLPADRFPDARAAARALGATAKVRPPPGPYDVDVLRAWLRGPERVSRSRTLAAETLMDATGGDPELLLEELGRWERAGVIDQHGVVDAYRLRALRGADRVSPLVQAALAQSEEALEEAVLAEVERQGGATSIPLIKLALFPLRHRAESVRRLLDIWADATFQLGTAAAFESLLVVLRQLDDPALAELEQIAEAGMLAARGERDRVEALLGATGGHRAAMVRLSAFRRGAESALESVVTDLERLAESDSGLRPQALMARGTLSYRRLDFRAAAQQLLMAAEDLKDAGSRAAALMWAGAALLEIPDPEGASELAQRALQDAVGAGRLLHEVSALGLLRHGAYRSMSGAAPDLDLVADLEALELPAATAYAALAEAGLAWRSGALDDCRALASVVVASGRRGRGHALALLGTALLLSLDGGPPDQLEGTRREAEALDPPGVGAQILALLGQAPGAPEPFRQRCRAAARERAWWTTGANVPREILAPSEVRGECDLPLPLTAEARE